MLGITLDWTIGLQVDQATSAIDVICTVRAGLVVSVFTHASVQIRTIVRG